jgi:ABC-type nickel/cobalt efflux system permease component RcnA
MSMDLAIQGASEGLSIALLGTALVFGLRHGFDWDHIAAITDITSSQEDSDSSFRFATIYALGHAFVVLLLGLVAIQFGSRIPAGLDTAMERVVGVTLLILGAYVFYSLIRHGRNFRMRSRWMLIISAMSRGLRSLRRKQPETVVFTHEHDHDHDEPMHGGHGHPPEAPSRSRLATLTRTHRHLHSHQGTLPEDPFTQYGPTTSFIVGMIHGVGAETPTQILLFLSAVGVGGTAAGVAVLASFLVGLLISNSLVALGSTMGYVSASRNFKLYAVVAVVTATFSLILGAMFVLGRGGELPVLLGG